MENIGSRSSHNKQFLQPNDCNFECNFRIKRERPQRTNALHQIQYMKLRSQTTSMLIKSDIQELLKYHLKKDSETIPEIVNIESGKSALSFQNIFVV